LFVDESGGHNGSDRFTHEIVLSYKAEVLRPRRKLDEELLVRSFSL